VGTKPAQKYLTGFYWWWLWLAASYGNFLIDKKA